MHFFEFNKIAGAMLGGLIFIMGLGIISETFFPDAPPEKPGYEISGLPEGGSQSAKESEDEVTPIALRLAEADIGSGEKQIKKCVSCHNFEKGTGNKTGPNLYAVLGRNVASLDGFAYSSALKKYGEDKVWTYEELDDFLQNPRKYIPGTTMGFAGLRNPETRADVIAYLRSLTDTAPPPLPEGEIKNEKKE